MLLNIQPLQVQIQELEAAALDAQRERDEAREALGALERRGALTAGEADELRAQLEAAERARKHAEGELMEAGERVSELTSANGSLGAARRKLEIDLQAMQASGGAVVVVSFFYNLYSV